MAGESEDLPTSTGITPDSLAAILKEKLEASHVEIEDLSGGCGQMFDAVIVSPQFAGKNTLARNRLVNGALKEKIKLIHAWKQKCLTPEEWERRKVVAG
ncbi:hypothetical protein M433DRAFT_159436 [Acidomyces richmondensis BFW]|nr:MAG: hypothetical protein FE78DRAFT_87469 [Acidomyces sp. 'richmondensis']KYG41112.1 hypothetical protein M433DRAFT_159436 [Acidomyces richmondensis BFW]